MSSLEVLIKALAREQSYSAQLEAELTAARARIAELEAAAG